MNARGVLYIVAAILIGVFVLANWTLLAASVELHLLIATIHAPLGVLILMIGAAILLIDLAVHTVSRRSWIRDRRLLTTDLESARQRVDREEESRTSALRVTLERELATMRGQLDRLLAGQSTLLAARAPERLTASRSGDSNGASSARLTES
jgi:uncharacterized integral membrane protein